MKVTNKRAINEVKSKTAKPYACAKIEEHVDELKVVDGGFRVACCANCTKRNRCKGFILPPVPITPR